MLTHTRTMFGSTTKNNSRVIPADPRTNIARSRSRGTVIFTHNRANLLDRAHGACPGSRGLGLRVVLLAGERPDTHDHQNDGGEGADHRDDLLHR